MSEFPPAGVVILANEGGLCNNAADPGGITNDGISLRFALAQYNLDHNMIFDTDHDGVVDGGDIKALTQDEALQIYKTYWWDKNGYATVNDQSVATKIIDAAINMGSHQAHQCVQKALNAAGCSVAVDGSLGPASYAAINSMNPAGLLNLIRASLTQFYLDLIAEKPVLDEFRGGWLRRAAQ